MLRDAYEPDPRFWCLIDSLMLEMEPELAQIDQLLEDEPLYQLVRHDWSLRYPKTLETGRPSTPGEVGDFLFIGLTDMRTGDVRQVVGRDDSGSYTNLFLHDDLSQEPSKDDHVELLTVMGANPSSQLKRGKFIDHDQRNPYLLYQDALRDLEGVPPPRCG